MKAEELINNNALSTRDLPYVINQDGKDQEVVFKEIALTALNMARMERIDSFSKNALSIINERKRQVEVEGFTIESDIQQYRCGELSDAAACYATRKYWRYSCRNPAFNLIWPWDPKWWKPAKNDSIAERKRELVKAGALILAELDRLESLEEKL